MISVRGAGADSERSRRAVRFALKIFRSVMRRNLLSKVSAGAAAGARPVVAAAGAAVPGATADLVALAGAGATGVFGAGAAASAAKAPTTDKERRRGRSVFILSYAQAG